jgi:two-component system NtrC family response regulator
MSHDDPQVVTARDLKGLLDPAGFHDVLAKGMEQTLAIEPLEKLAIERALRLTDGNRSKAALLLGISRDTLYRKLREFAAETT